MTKWLYPRLAAPLALARLRDWHGDPPEEVRGHVDAWHPRTHYYEVGQHVDDARLLSLRRDVRGIAERCGWPDSRRRPDLAMFDWQVGQRMLDEPMADVGADGAWCHLTTGLVPDVVVWRWGWPDPKHRSIAEIPRRSFDRYLGGLRNALRRSWYRLSTYGAGEHDPPWRYWEDAVVSVEERPSIGADPRVARLVFRVCEPLLDVDPYEVREGVFRDVVIDLCEIAGWRELRILDDESLAMTIQEVLRRRVPDSVDLPVADDRWLATITGGGMSDEGAALLVELSTEMIEAGRLPITGASTDFLPTTAQLRDEHLAFTFSGLEGEFYARRRPGDEALRIHIPVREFYQANDATAGDLVRIARESPDCRYSVTIEPRGGPE